MKKFKQLIIPRKANDSASVSKSRDEEFMQSPVYFLYHPLDLNEVYQTIFIAFLLPLINNKYMNDL